MKAFPKCDSKSVKKIFELADRNICNGGMKDSEGSTFIFQEGNAICTFSLIDKSGFKNHLLNSCYYLALTFCGITNDGRSYIQPFDHEKADRIIRAFFPKTNFVWEHAPFTKEGVAAFTHHFYLFVSIPYGKMPVILQAEDMKELLAGNYFLYGGVKIDGQ